VVNNFDINEIDESGESAQESSEPQPKKSAVANLNMNALVGRISHRNSEEEPNASEPESDSE